MNTRFVWLVVLLMVQLLYVPISRIVRGGVVLETPWDAHIPLWPIWAIPYLLSLVWWCGCYTWAAWKMDIHLWKSFLISNFAVVLVSYVIYLVYPSYVHRPPLPERHSWQIEWVRLIYHLDRPYNAFPSGHAYNTVLIALFWCRWHPQQCWLWIGMTVIILLSTLFTRQHNLPDLIGGVALAAMGYRFGLWWVAR